MSDELKTLQTTAEEARASADSLKGALTGDSTDADREAADAAEQTAVSAEQAFADAKAKAEGDGSGDVQPKVGDVCTLDDGTEGVITDTSEAQDGSQLVCQPKPKVDPNESRTAFVPDLKPGDSCTCPDGRPGTVVAFAGNPPVCFPIQDPQG